MFATLSRKSTRKTQAGIPHKKECKSTYKHMKKFNLISNQRDANSNNQTPLFAFWVGMGSKLRVGTGLAKKEAL